MSIAMLIVEAVDFIMSCFQMMLLGTNVNIYIVMFMSAHITRLAVYHVCTASLSIAKKITALSNVASKQLLRIDSRESQLPANAFNMRIRAHTVTAQWHDGANITLMLHPYPRPC